MASAWIERIKRPGRQAVYRVKWRELVDGKWKKIPSEVMKNREQAEQVLVAKSAELAALNTRRGSAGRIVPWVDLLERWRSSRIGLGRVTATYGREVVEAMTRLAEQQGWKSVADITRAAVDGWRDKIAERYGTPRGTHKPFRQLKAVLKWAAFDPDLRQPIDMEVLSLEQRVQQHRAPPPLLTREQVDAAIKRAYSLGERFGAIIEHLSRYGCRPIDACRLRVSDWNGRDRLLTLRETKNGDDVTHPIDPAFAQVLDRLCAGRVGHDPLYLSPNGEGWRINALGTATELRDWYRNHLSSWLQWPRNQWGIYLLKDHAITRMELAGIDDRTKSLFTGHRDLSCLQRYKTTNLEHARAALGMLGVGADRGRRGGKNGGNAKARGGKTGGRAVPVSRRAKAQRP
jgi:integrase